MQDFLFTSESVTEGHPDKICDQVSDAILDAILAKDKYAHVAVECVTTTGMIFITGELTTNCYVDIPAVARETIKDIGYTNPEFGLDSADCAVLTAIHEQSQNIAVGVTGTKKREQGAGDQGCLAKGSLVRTARGFIPIESVKIGDIVETPFGFKKVTGARPTGKKKTVTIKLKNSFSLRCTPDHRILCLNKNGFFSWKEAQQLNTNDYVCTLKPSSGFSIGELISTERKNQFFTKYNHKIYGSEIATLDEKMAYLLGELIGDGCVTNKKGRVQLAFGNNKKHATVVKTMLDGMFPGQWKLSVNKKNKDISLITSSVLIRKHLESFGLAYAKSPAKKTPASIFTSPPEVIKSYLRGLFDSDGTIISDTGRSKNNIRIRLCSSSKQLLNETQLLLNDFSVQTSLLFNRPAGTPVGKNRRYKSNYDNYVLNVKGYESYQNFAKEIGFMDSKKAERMGRYATQTQVKPASSRGTYLLPHPSKQELIDEERLGLEMPLAVSEFKEITGSGITDVYDLEIEGLHVFSGNGIYVHNSMFGFACKETPELMPLPIMLAHRLAMRLAEVRKKKILPWVRPDGKSQVTIQYENGKPLRIDAVVIAVHHSPETSPKKVRKEIIESVIQPVCGKMMDKNTKIFINETGIFTVGGPEADAGLTGRKIIVDTYGGYAPHGGGAMSGKDSSKVDRSASYAARYIAKNIVAAGLADKCQVQLSYSIGVAEPVSITVDCFGTESIPEKRIAELVYKYFPLKPADIISKLKLLRPIYRETAAYGHFGRSGPGFTWEKTDKVAVLKSAAKKFL